MLGVLAGQAAAKVLSPAAVAFLPLEKPARRARQSRIRRRRAGRAQAAHREEDRVRELDAPRGGKGTVGMLGAAQIPLSATHCAADPLFEDTRARRAKPRERLQTGCRALDVAALGHAVSEHL